jgi:DMSO/TMAO reductase YedYZ molybdopterin-dependent catalytic subunit
MAIISRGFTGWRSAADVQLPPEQYLYHGFSGVVRGADAARVARSVGIHNRGRKRYSAALGLEVISRPARGDFHRRVTLCHPVVQARYFLEGVSLDALLAGVTTDAPYAMVHSYGDYTTNLPLQDLRNGQAWITFRFDNQDLAPEHGGPARLLVPHLYLWKSAKRVRGITLLAQDSPGFWGSLGYHNYGDPWREQRYQGD